MLTLSQWHNRQLLSKILKANFALKLTFLLGFLLLSHLFDFFLILFLKLLYQGQSFGFFYSLSFCQKLAVVNTLLYANRFTLFFSNFLLSLLASQTRADFLGKKIIFGHYFINFLVFIHKPRLLALRCANLAHRVFYILMLAI